MSKKILITGSNGLLGQKLAFLFSQSEQYELLLTSKHDTSVFGNVLPYKKMDTSVKQQVAEVIRDFSPDVVINAGAMTDVDGCEREKEKAWLANVVAVENLMTEMYHDTHLIHFSTDYVFDGKNGPYDESAKPNPISYYGKTKLASENLLHGSGKRFTILRTMILYGMGMNVKTNFALWLIRSLEEQKTIRVVTDQLGNPTLADDVAFATLNVVEYEREGMFHISGSEIVNRFQFAKKLAAIFKFDDSLILPTTTAELHQLAPRPLTSGFITLKAETELGITLSDAEKGITTLFHQLEIEKRYT